MVHIAAAQPRSSCHYLNTKSLLEKMRAEEISDRKKRSARGREESKCTKTFIRHVYERCLQSRSSLSSTALEQQSLCLIVAKTNGQDEEGIASGSNLEAGKKDEKGDTRRTGSTDPA